MIKGDIRLRNFDKLVDRDVKGNLSISISKLVEKLILFESLIIESDNLKEIPLLINQIGFEQTTALLKSGVVEIHNGMLGIGSRRRDLMHLVGFSDLDAFRLEPKQHFETCVKEIKKDCNLADKKFTQLEQQLRFVVKSYSKESLTNFKNIFLSDLSTNNNYLRQAIRVKIKKTLNIEIDVNKIEANTERFKDDLYRHESNLKELLGIDKRLEFQILDDALLSIGGLNEKILQMDIYNCITGFKHDEVSIFQGKLQFLENELDSKGKDKQFHRLVNIAGLPELNDKKDFNIERLLEIRQEDEIVNFRNWLNTSNTFSDEELSEMLNNFKVKLSKHLNSKWGKTIKFIVSNGVGMLNPAAGIALGFADTFLIENFLKTPGVITFLHNSYPTIFQSQNN